ncbi:uncharacterized protein LOC120177425 [Hibiscus syriacus]|uniref:uncharacterized protein LOC120177425 n=1 Tax=Hibiscus syriacus TaxID=106335 RepID=UPI00192352EA|nr:uncharacterized protein LOC120177425 [Hibiscus syriacus]
MDSVTTSNTRLEFAKICVEIGVNEEIPKVLDVVFNDGLTTSVHVEVPWLPPRCRNCKVFGHNDKNCLVKHLAKPTTNQSDLNCSESIKLPTDTSSPNPSPTKNLQVKEANSDQNCINLKEQQPIPTTESQPIFSDTSATVEVGSSSLHKCGRGRPPEEKVVFAGSKNRFELLNSIDKIPSTQEVPQRKSRVASKGVVELVKDLKQKKNEKLDKTKSSIVEGEGATLEPNL